MADATPLVDGSLATAAGGQPRALAEAAVVGPAAISRGRAVRGQASDTKPITLGLATTTMLPLASAAPACDRLASTDR